MQNRTKVQLIAMLVAFLTSGAHSATNIVNNGSFEEPDISFSPYLFYLPVYAGESTITSWTVEASSSALGVDVLSTRTGISQLAYQGSQSIDMAGSPGRASIYQDLVTVAGQLYRLDFSASTNNGPSLNSLSISWNGSTFETLSPPPLGTWSSYSYDLLATSTVTRLNFIGNIDGNNGAMIDAVSVSAVPEPAANSLLLLGALVLYGAIHRSGRSRIDA